MGKSIARSYVSVDVGRPMPIGGSNGGKGINTVDGSSSGVFSAANLPLWISVGICIILGAFLGIIVGKRSAAK